MTHYLSLSRRERQIMEIIHRCGQATAAEVHEQLPDAPSNTAVRTLLRILEEKGHLKHHQQGKRFVYLPTVSPEKAKRSAIKTLLDTFFEGSAESAVLTLIDESGRKMTDEQLDRIVEKLTYQRKENRS